MDAILALTAFQISMQNHVKNWVIVIEGKVIYVYCAKVMTHVRALTCGNWNCS